MLITNSKPELTTKGSEAPLPETAISGPGGELRLPRAGKAGPYPCYINRTILNNLLKRNQIYAQ